MRTGAALLCDALVASGARVVFGVPGTQNVELFEALRRSSLRVVLTTSELTAAFMAGAYARSTAQVGVIVTIPGPGFALALPGLAEAFLDSAAVLHITGLGRSPGRRFALQALDQAAMARPVTKAVGQVRSVEELAPVLADVWSAAISGEPGPAVLEVAADVLSADAHSIEYTPVSRTPAVPNLDAVRDRAKRSRRPVIYAGQGALPGATELRQLAEQWRSPVITTPSARGILPEDHALALGFDPLRGEVEAVTALCAESDLVLALGCKFSHNGSAGFGLQLAADTLVHVDASAETLNANYPAALAVQCDARDALLALLDDMPARSAWNPDDVAGWRTRLRTLRSCDLPEPRIAGAHPMAAADLFAALRRALPRDAVVVTDSGMHQILTRRYYDVLAPGGLLLPSDFQSMGFGVPAAVAARLAMPERPVVAIVGDGGLSITGMELLTAAREQVAVVVVVFNDGYLNQIRLQQLREYGHDHAVALGPLDVEAFAAAVGAAYVPLADDPEAALLAALATPGPVIVDVPIGDSMAVRARGARSALREAARDALGPRLVRWLKQLTR